VVPKLHRGRGFQGLSDYLLHDKNARTDERVAWTHMENLTVRDAHRAYKEMQETVNCARQLKREAGRSTAGRKRKNPCLHLSLSWAADQEPMREQMIDAGKDVLKKLGLDKHQALFVCHNDEPQPHIHIMLNRVDRENGIINTLSRSKRKLSQWAMAYERAEGKIRCQKRVENNRALEQGAKPRYKDPVIKNAWERSDSGKSFARALADAGYTLAQGNQRVVVIDPQGKSINPARHLVGVKARDVAARLEDIRNRLPSVEAVKARREERDRQRPGDARARTAEAEKGAEDGRSVGKEKGKGAAGRPEAGAREAFERAAAKRTADKLLKDITRRQAVFAGWELQSILKGHGHGPELVSALEKDGKILRLRERATGKATENFTTPEVRAQEQRVLATAERLHARQNWRVEDPVRKNASARRTLDDEQTAALEHALSPAGLSVIQGRAGTGKSHTIGAVREALQEQGHRVIGLAPTNTVAGDLKHDGFAEARTVHSLLWHIERQRPEGKLDRNTVLIVDEAAMMDAKTTERLLDEAERAGSKVILVGDERQLCSVERGGLFAPIAEKLGSAAITTVRRQKADWDRQAAEDFSSGRFAEGLEAWDKHGRIEWTQDNDQARKALLLQWARDTQQGIGNRFVFAYTNAEVDKLNAAMRALEVVRGRVDKTQAVTLKSERFGTIELARGERVQFRSNDKRRGIANGLLGTVERAGPDGQVQVRTEKGKTVIFNAADEKRPEIQYGYAGTIYRGQGKTLDEAYLLHTRHWRDKASYVALTRARHGARLFVARDQARGVEALARQMGRISDAGASLGFATAEEIRARQSGSRQAAAEQRGTQRPLAERYERAAGGQGIAAARKAASPAPPPARKTPVDGSVRGHFAKAGANRTEANDNRERATRARRRSAVLHCPSPFVPPPPLSPPAFLQGGASFPVPVPQL
jgi:hypothetical protein